MNAVAVHEELHCDMSVHSSPVCNSLQVELCEACIKWAQDENRVFLRQALQSRLVAVYVDSVQYTAALTIAAPLLKELKKIDDKALLVEVVIVLYCTVL